MELQRIPEWYIDRIGKFTGSEFFKLLTDSRTKGQLFGDTGMEYINDKVSEILTNGMSVDYKAFKTKETEWGNYWEPTAKIVFTERTGIEVIPCGFINIKERFGCSPDGDSLDFSIEVKCPYKTSNHVKYLELESNEDLKKCSKAYYTQVQIEMMALKKDKGLFISYDPRCANESLQLKVLVIEKDEEYQNEILFRYKEALKILELKIENLFKMQSKPLQILKPVA